MASPYAIAQQQLQILQAYQDPYAKKQGKGGRGGQPDPNDQWGIPGFDAALGEALKPIIEAVMIHNPGEANQLEDLKSKLGQKIVKASKKFVGDERASQRGTASQARGLIEEFVEAAAGAVSAGFYDKPWFDKVNLSAPLLAAALHTFKDAKIFTRTLAPMLERYVEDGLFKYAEEERISKATWEAVEASGVKEAFQKKCNKHLQTAYDDAHIKAPYGTTTAETAELSMLQDFVKGWMSEFVGRSWDVLETGIGAGARATRDEKVLFVTVLFQNLTISANAALPHELTSLIESPPPSPWAFVAEAAEVVFQELEQAQQAKKMAQQQWGKGWGMDAMGWGKGWDMGGKGFGKGW